MTTIALSPVDNSNLVGTVAADDALMGNIGEIASSAIAAGSAVSLTTVTPADITSISLTAGDWDVWGLCALKGGATTTILYVQCSISSTSATIDSTIGHTLNSYLAGGTPFGSITEVGFTPPPQRLSLSATTTIYLTVNASFAVSTLSGYGTILARRRR